MKNKILFFLAIGALCLTSCSKDLSEEIVDTWNITLIQFTDCTDIDDNLSFVADETGCSILDGESVCFSFIFTEAGGITALSSYMDDGETETESTTGSYTIDGENMTMNLDGAFNGTATVDGNEWEFVGEFGDLGCSATFKGVRQ